jgi:hypothetical protein
MTYFRCYEPSSHRTFVVEIPSRQRIAEARAIIDGNEKKKIHVSGILVKTAVAYNKPWRWFIEPSSIEFFQNHTEVCDAALAMVEERLDEIGGSFLPHNKWCPWGSSVIEELGEVWPLA